MEAQIDLENLPALCRGVSFLGSGGGGDVKELLPIVENMLRCHGPVPLISLNDLNDNDLVVAIELIGAPIPKSHHNDLNRFCFSSVLQYALKDLKRTVRALIPVEIGGGNALAPLCVAGEMGFPILDGDLLGRAFPEIFMISTNIFGIMPSIAYIADPETGETHTIECTSYEELEVKARSQAVKHKTTAAILIPIILTAQEAKKSVIPGTIRHSLLIGTKLNIQELTHSVQGKVHATGIIEKWDYTITSGFLTGELIIRSDLGEILSINVKNEYLSLSLQGQVIVKAPDIISLLLSNTLSSVLSDQVSVGDEVICVSCKGPEIWYSEIGLRLTQLACFGDRLL